MRELPLNDPQWVCEHINIKGYYNIKNTIQKYHVDHINIDIKKLHVTVVSNIESSYYNMYNNFNDTDHVFILFEDTDSSEVFYKACSMKVLREEIFKVYEKSNIIFELQMNEDNIFDEKKEEDKYHILLNNLKSYKDIYKIIKLYYYTHDPNVYRDISTFDCSLNNHREFVTKYITDKHDLTSLNIVSTHELLNELYRKCSRIEVLKYIATQNSDSMYMQKIYKILTTNMVEDYIKEVTIQKIQKLEYKIPILKVLLHHNTMFSGKYNVSKRCYNDNKKSNTFDIVIVEIGMLSNHQKNVTFIKNNSSTIKGIIKEIIVHHPSTLKYANYLQMFRLTLTRDNTLVAEFCFKDKLMEENNDKNE